MLPRYSTAQKKFSMFYPILCADTPFVGDERVQALAVALKVNDQHPDIPRILEAGGEAAAMLQEAMAKHRASAMAKVAQAATQALTEGVGESSSNRRRLAL